MERKPSGKQIVLFTAIFVNVLLFALIWAKHEIVIPPEADTAVAESNEETSLEYDYELEDVSETDSWRIEHYQQFEITVNEAGEVLSKEPTEQTQNVKYWIGD